MKFLAIIPARSGSKGLPMKNTSLFAGKPLIAHTIEAALNSGCMDKVIVSTDSAEIAEVACRYGAEVPSLRPEELSRDEASAVEVVKHAVETLAVKEKYEAQAIAYLQPTSPLRTAGHIKSAVTKFLASPSADSLVSVTKVPHNMNPESIMKMTADGFVEDYDAALRKSFQRQSKPTYYARNGAAIYLLKSKLLPQLKGSLFGGKILPWEMSRWSSVDIDTSEDMQLAEIFARYYMGGGL